MITITENIEEKAYHYKEWYKEMNDLIGESFISNSTFENSLSVGLKIIFDIENPILPNGLSIPQNSKITMKTLAGRTIVVIGVTIQGNNRDIALGIRSMNSSD